MTDGPFLPKRGGKTYMAAFMSTPVQQPRKVSLPNFRCRECNWNYQSVDCRKPENDHGLMKNNEFDQMSALQRAGQCLVFNHRFPTGHKPDDLILTTDTLYNVNYGVCLGAVLRTGSHNFLLNAAKRECLADRRTGDSVANAEADALTFGLMHSIKEAQIKGSSRIICYTDNYLVAQTFKTGDNILKNHPETKLNLRNINLARKIAGMPLWAQKGRYSSVKVEKKPVTVTVQYIPRVSNFPADHVCSMGYSFTERCIISEPVKTALKDDPYLVRWYTKKLPASASK